jgi:hypothetical protein
MLIGVFAIEDSPLFVAIAITPLLLPAPKNEAVAPFLSNVEKQRLVKKVEEMDRELG